MPSFRVFLHSLLLLKGLSVGWIVLANSVAAATLAFKGEISSQQLTQSWKSPFSGPVTILLNPKLGKASGLELTVSIDDEVAFESNEFIGTSLSGINLPQRSEVRFEATVPDNTDFSLDVEILVEQSGLVFLDTEDSLGFDHVGLFHDDKIYESHPGYTQGLYKNIFSSLHEEISSQNGVQSSHKLGTFLGTTINANSLTGENFDAELIPIPQEDAKALESWIYPELELGKGYISHSNSLIFRSPPTPFDLKGHTGFYSEVGLIERAAEESLNGHDSGEVRRHSGEGYIPNHKEFFDIKCLCKINYKLFSKTCQYLFNLCNQTFPALIRRAIKPRIFHESPSDFNQI